MMKKYFALLCIAFLVGGCAYGSVKVGRDEASIAQVRERFSQEVAQEFSLLSSIIFSYKFFTVSCLGLTMVDAPQGTFAVAGMTPVGVKLFEVRSENGVVSRSFALPEFQKRGDVARAVADDVGKIYFNRVPSPGSSARFCGRFLIFSENTSTGVVEYCFTSQAENMVLAEKRCVSAGRRIWTVRYAHYVRDAHGKLQPLAIDFRQHSYGYRLRLRVKEVR